MGDYAKSPVIIGLTGKPESAYGGGASLSISTDGILLAEAPKLSWLTGADGGRTAPSGTSGYQTRAKPIGRGATTSFKTEFKGGGAAYSSAVKPQPHLFWTIGGMNAALTTTSGVEKYVYTRAAGPVGYTSGALNAYAQGHLYPLVGAFADWQMDGDDTGIVYLTANISALVGATISDSITPPTISYPLIGVVPPLSNGTSLFTIGNFNNVNVRKWSLKLGRSITPRKVSGGLVGFAIGRCTPQLDITFETTALSGSAPFHSSTSIDPFQLFENATSLAASLQIGSTQYNRMTIAMPGAQLMNYPETDEDGDVVVTSLSLQLNPSAGNLTDEISITCD